MHPMEKETIAPYVETFCVVGAILWVSPKEYIEEGKQ
jgi:hypothetical protein